MSQQHPKIINQPKKAAFAKIKPHPRTHSKYSSRLIASPSVASKRKTLKIIWRKHCSPPKRSEGGC